MEKWLEDVKNNPTNADIFIKLELQRRLIKIMTEDLIERHRRAWFGPSEPSGTLSQAIIDKAKLF